MDLGCSKPVPMHDLQSLRHRRSSFPHATLSRSGSAVSHTAAAGQYDWHHLNLRVTAIIITASSPQPATATRIRADAATSPKAHFDSVHHDYPPHGRFANKACQPRPSTRERRYEAGSIRPVVYDCGVTVAAVNEGITSESNTRSRSRRAGPPAGLSIRLPPARSIT